MKVFSVVGYSKSGKTTTIEQIIKELKKRNYSVGSVKDIHFEGFHLEAITSSFLALVTPKCLILSSAALAGTTG